jgi:phospholipid/cholesterol/gamma-HCH transport system ATP-binding protein
MIRVNDLHKRYGDQKVLDGVNFTIQRGTVTTIIGRSGGGKSVLLRHLMGLETPDSGEVIIDGENLSRMGDADLNRIRRRFGILFQEGALFDSLTVAENVAFPLEEHTKLSESEIMDVVREKLATVGMTGHEDKYPAQISGGMRKRTALARALALNPDIVFFDEPTTGLDPVTKSAIYELIRKTHQLTSTTYVIVSHDIRGVFSVSDETMMLWDGKILARGTPEEMERYPDPIVQQFISGSPEGPIHVD